MYTIGQGYQWPDTKCWRTASSRKLSGQRPWRTSNLPSPTRVRDRTKIAELLADERCRQAVLSFLATTDVERTSRPPVAETERPERREDRECEEQLAFLRGGREGTWGGAFVIFFGLCPREARGLRLRSVCEGGREDTRGPQSLRSVGRYAHDPLVEEQTHTSQTPDAEVGGAPGVPIVEGVGGATVVSYHPASPLRFPITLRLCRLVQDRLEIGDGT